MFFEDMSKKFDIEVRKLHNGNYTVFVFENEGDDYWYEDYDFKTENIPTKTEVAKIIAKLKNREDLEIENVHDFSDLEKRKIEKFVCQGCGSQDAMIAVKSCGEEYITKPNGIIVGFPEGFTANNSYIDEFIEYAAGKCAHCEEKGYDYVSIETVFEDGTTLIDHERRVIMMTIFDK